LTNTPASIAASYLASRQDLSAASLQPTQHVLSQEFVVMLGKIGKFCPDLNNGTKTANNGKKDAKSACRK
jgi:hypothetical protein